MNTDERVFQFIQDITTFSNLNYSSFYMSYKSIYPLVVYLTLFASIVVPNIEPIFLYPIFL
jgi:hypothetical protein